MRKGIIYVYFNKAKYEKEGIEKYYVGQTVRTMEQRAGKDGTGYHWDDPNCDYKFARAIKKWGWDAFEGRVLEEVYEEDLDELEKFYIKYFDSYENGYNTTLGGEGTRGYNYNEEAKKRQSKAQRKRFEDPKEREKMGKTQRKRFEDPKEREKCGQPGEKNYGAKKVYCNELNILFSYIRIAEKYCINILNIKIGPINRVCNGKRNFTGKLADGTKLTWNWLEDVDQETLDKAEYIDSKKYEEILSQNVNVCNK